MRLASRPSRADFASAAPCRPLAAIPGPCGGGACQQQGFQQTVGHGGAAVDRKFDHIFPGIGVGRPVEQRHRFVHLLAPQQVVAQHGRIPFGVGYPTALPHRHKDFFHNGIGVGTRYPDHRNAALSRRGGQRTDGLFQTVHKMLLV